MVPSPRYLHDAAARDAAFGTGWRGLGESYFAKLAIRVLMAAAGVHLERGEIPAARTLLAQVDHVGSPSQRIESLEIRRRASINGDPAAAKLLNQLFTDTLLTVRALDDTATQLDLRKRIDAGK